MDSNQLDPMDADAYFERGTDFGLQRDYENAIADLTEAIRLSPRNAKFYYRRATIHFIRSVWNEAIADYTEALRLKPDPSDKDVWNFTIDEVYHGRGIAYRFRGDYDAALEDFGELIKMQPDDPLHYHERSVIFKLKGDFDNSLADLNTLHRLDPDDRTFWTLMADVQLRKGNKSAAMALYDEQVKRFGSPASYFYRAELWKELGDLTKAIADFEEAIKLSPGYHAAYLSLGETYLANGNSTKAIDILTALMGHEPGYRYTALVIRARAHLASGNSEEAKRDFDAAIRVTTEDMAESPSFTEAYIWRGHAHAAQGHTREAVADYEKALEAIPAHPESAMMREYILNHP